MTVGTGSMQNKKDDVTTVPTKQEAVPVSGSLFSFFGDVKSEFQKITWTDKEELIAYTKIVALTTSAVGVGIFCIDAIIQGSLAVLSELVRLIAG